MSETYAVSVVGRNPPDYVKDRNVEVLVNQYVLPAALLHPFNCLHGFFLNGCLHDRLSKTKF